MSELADRRQRALEAFWDAPSGSAQEGIQDAIKTATQVKLTSDIIDAGIAAWRAASASWTDHPGPRQLARARAMFEAAGFEVIE